jgi:L,D-transpeptidase ErfK/SrfK
MNTSTLAINRFPPQRNPHRNGRLSVLLLLAGGLLSGCAEWMTYFGFGQPPMVFEVDPKRETVQSHGFFLNGEDSVIGRLGQVPIKEGDTLLDIARHYGLGYLHIADANPDMDVWIPHGGESAVLPLQFILPEAPRTGVVVNLAAMRLFYFSGTKANAKLSTWPIGIGREGRSTPLGIMTVDRKTEHPTWHVPESIRKRHEEEGDPLPAVVLPGPDNPLGDFALYLSRPSYLIHGTNKPFSIGLRASNGCVRLYPEDIAKAFQEIPVKTPLVVVNQPYLLGWLGGMLYLEAHKPFEEIDVKQAKANLTAKLKLIEKKQQRKLDWPKIEETLKQARGIPVPIFEYSESLAQRLAGAARLERPALLNGQPSNANLPATGWLLRTAETDDDFWARRLAAQLNHLGPRIPARMVGQNRRYRLLAGPFADETAARKAQIVMSEDFNAKTELVKPSKHAGWK